MQKYKGAITTNLITMHFTGANGFKHKWLINDRRRQRLSAFINSTDRLRMQLIIHIPPTRFSKLHLTPNCRCRAPDTPQCRVTTYLKI